MATMAVNNGLPSEGPEDRFEKAADEVADSAELGEEHQDERADVLKQAAEKRRVPRDAIRVGVGEPTQDFVPLQTDEEGNHQRGDGSHHSHHQNEQSALGGERVRVDSQKQQDSGDNQVNDGAAQ